MKKFLICCLVFSTSLVLCYAQTLRSQITLEEKICQMVMVGFAGTDFSGKESDLIRQIESGEIGGVLILSCNIVDRKQIIHLVKQIKDVKTKYPLLIAIDQEGGMIGRLNSLNGFRDFPSSREMVKTKSPQEAFILYVKMARMLKSIGINLNLAPVVDLDYPGTIISKKERSFSPDPDVVIKYSEEFISAHRKAGLLTAIKHYPGHGSAKGDTHLGFSDVTSVWSKIELEPYQELIKKGLVDMIMTAHIYNSKVDTEYPVSLSETHINHKLRKELGFKGVVITDDLKMGAVKPYDLEELVIKAIDAGSDILLFSLENPARIRDIILKAVKEGRLKENRIEESFQRITKLKRIFSK